MAVLFADAADSEALCRRLGEHAARAALDGQVQALHRVAAAHDGRFIKRLGDGALFAFDEARAAVQAACAGQSMLRGTRGSSDDPRLRMGAHYGAVFLEAGDVFGGTVNAAAYLANLAAADQILATETVIRRLAGEARAAARPIFQALLKGEDTATTVYQVSWRSEDRDAATVSLEEAALIPRDTGSLLVCYGERCVRIDRQHPTVSLGRSAECDIVVPDMYASREHATIKLRRLQFYLLDHSTNGTFVSMLGEQVHVLRGELMLAESGEIALGRRAGSGEAAVVRFERDRRALYRV